jgi:putative cardiolipin synthase
MVDGEAGDHRRPQHGHEYFDYDHKYNFRDRDVLLLGRRDANAQASFERFWNSPLSVAIETQLEGPMPAAEIAATYRRLHAHAADPRNFAPEVHRPSLPFPRISRMLAAQLRWGASSS